MLPRQHVGRAFAATLTIAMAAAMATQAVQASSASPSAPANPAKPAKPAKPADGPTGMKRLHYFAGDDGPEGFGPYAPPVAGPDGNFYGTTFFGGPENFRCDCAVGGTLYRMTPAGALTVLHTFSGSDGIGATGALVPGTDGQFYGLTSGGGDANGGTAFKVDLSGRFTLLATFGGANPAGGRPWLGALAAGPDGNFYGANSQGGAHGAGTLFRMTPAGAVTVLHAFEGGAADGARPQGGVMFASDGNLYGTTACGGANERAGECAGTVYRWSATAGFTLLHSFDPRSSAQEGTAPQAAPTELNGMLYGTTSQGGNADAGAVWRLPRSGGATKVLHVFTGGVAAQTPTSDGKTPTGRLVLAKDGRLYGTTANGGPNHVVHPQGDGTIFSLAGNGAYRQDFAFGKDIAHGSHPLAGLAAAPDGTLYGATESGNSYFTGLAYSWTIAP